MPSLNTSEEEELWTSEQKLANTEHTKHNKQLNNDQQKSFLLEED